MREETRYHVTDSCLKPLQSTCLARSSKTAGRRPWKHRALANQVVPFSHARLRQWGADQRERQPGLDLNSAVRSVCALLFVSSCSISCRALPKQQNKTEPRSN